MKKFLMTVAHFRRNEEGVTLVEYGIAITLAVAVGTLALTDLSGAIIGNMNVATGTMGGEVTAAP